MRQGLLVALLAALAFPAAATAQQQHTAQSGATSATLSGTHLTIARAGQVLFDGVLCPDARCRPDRPQDWDPLVVADLDGDGEPEVTASIYTGGAHCCYVEHTFKLAGAAYAQITHDFADPGAVVRDVNRDGQPELVSADARVANAILRFMRLPYAASAEPLQVWRLRNARLVDATRRYRRQLRADAQRWWAGYLRYRGPSGRPVLGMLGAWAADQYRLGRRRRALRILHRERRRGHLRQVDWFTGRNLGGKRYVRKLDRTLRRSGYGRR
jgi:hypothetical protein